MTSINTAITGNSAFAAAGAYVPRDTLRSPGQFDRALDKAGTSRQISEVEAVSVSDAQDTAQWLERNVPATRSMNHADLSVRAKIALDAYNHHQQMNGTAHAQDLGRMLGVDFYA